MNLPNYFLADLPPEATLTPSMISEASQTLKRNREQYLAGRSTAHLIKVLSELAEAWLDPNFPFRRFALERGPGVTGFSAQVLASGLDSFFRQLSPSNESPYSFDLSVNVRLPLLIRSSLCRLLPAGGPDLHK